MTNSVDPDQTAPIGAVCSGSTLFASILKLSLMFGNYLLQTTFSDAFFLDALRVEGLVLPPLEPKTENCLSPISFDCFFRRMTEV